MASQPVPPLRIQKGTPLSSPMKQGGSLPRPLSELAPTEKRRNSPSFNQVTKKSVFNQDSSPFQSSPFNASDANSSPRLFWQGREPRFNSENAVYGQRESSPSPTRRSSIEKLQKASRVKNSNIFALEQKQEYDPTSVPSIERPLAKPIQGNAYGGSGLEGLRASELRRRDSQNTESPYSPTKTPLASRLNGMARPISPSKEQVSPTKSSLSKRHNATEYDPASAPWQDEQSDEEKSLPPGKVLHRHAKSVTFDAAPPQVNEYELATPDLSSVASRENSYDSEEEADLYNHDFNMDHDDSFDASLEDTDKTPVVGPEDWRHHGMMGNRFDDPFEGPEGSPMPDAAPTRLDRPATPRTDSLNSNGEQRPLPPLPGGTPASSSGLTGAMERGSLLRSLPTPPRPSSLSKSDILGLAGNKMSLEERLHLMMIQDDHEPTAAEQQRERRMIRAGGRDEKEEIKIFEDEDAAEDTLGELGEFKLPARISRESILRKISGEEANADDTMGGENDYTFSSPPPEERSSTIPDPDVPLPSTEGDSVMLGGFDAEDSVVIKPEPEDEDPDVYAIPELYERNESRMADYDYDSLMRPTSLGDQDAESQYSDHTPVVHHEEDDSKSTLEEQGPPTPRPTSPMQNASVDKEADAPREEKEAAKERNSMLPDFSTFSFDDDFGLGLRSYMSPSPPAVVEAEKKLTVAPEVPEPIQRPVTPLQQTQPLPLPDYEGTGWGPQEEEHESELGTPDSVIRHPVAESPIEESPSVPEQVATIKSASGSSRLKTRPSSTPADLLAMREARRQVSGETPVVPPIPAKHKARNSMTAEQIMSIAETQSDGEAEVERKTSFKKKSLTLDFDVESGLSLEKDFERVIETQKVAFYRSYPSLKPYQDNIGEVSSSRQVSLARQNDPLTTNANVTARKQRGYLMRQNTKLVVASSDDVRGARSAGNSPIKKERPQSWTVEPWNAQRKKSAREPMSPRKKVADGPVPPLPGQQSNVGLGILVEDEVAVTANEPEVPESGERGRLFVKVLGVKDLDLPLPRNERSWFSLTLDNGVHCVTTAWLELGKNAPIGQEFELVVPSDLEFQLTLNVKLEKPQFKPVLESPTKRPVIKIPKQSTFSRVFQSPKKRKEMEMKQKEEEQRAAEQARREAQAKRMSAIPTAWDLLSPLANADGSFARSYVCLKDHESHCYGRPYVVDVACFNEWALADTAGVPSSVKSKRGTTELRRRAPYKIGKLELQLLFVPKPKGAKDDDMPKSMNSCIREMKEAETALARTWEGHLSQQGGDCPYWRRRFFKLSGTKLTAYHESTRQPRATINLANAAKLIDDRRSLTQKETTTKSGGRRKSGFAEEEEGYMFVEEGFRIRFANGEVIDFYADSAKDKEGWMKVLDQCIGKESSGSARAWCDLVLKREESLKRKASGGGRPSIGPKPAAGGRVHSRTKSMIV